MRRAITTLALALWLSGCGGRVPLLTGLDTGYAGGQHPSCCVVLVADPEYGTRIDGGGPVMWPVGYTARQAGFLGEIEVLDEAGDVVATTGRAYAMAPAPAPVGEEARRLMERTGAIAAPDEYPWDLVDCSPGTTDPDAATYCLRTD